MGILDKLSAKKAANKGDTGPQVAQPKLEPVGGATAAKPTAPPPELSETSNTERVAFDAVQESLLFLAHYFNRSVEREHLTGGIPLPAGRITSVELIECAGRAGLTVTLSPIKPEHTKPTMLPALIMDDAGDAIVVLHRDGGKLECAIPGVKGSQWIQMNQLLREHPGQWYFVRPEFHFDVRSLLYGVAEPRRWFWDVFKANRNIYMWALLGTIVINILAIVLPFYTMAVYDRVIPNNALESLWVLTTAAVAVTLFDLLMKILRGYLLEAAARKADIVLSTHIFARAMKLRIATRPASGGVLANTVRDFEVVRDFFTSATLTLLGDLPFMFVFFAIIALIGGWLAVIPFVLVPIAILISLGLRKILSKMIHESTKESAQRTAHLFEVMNGLDIIKGLGAEAWARRKWEALTLKIAESNLHMHEVTNFNGYMVATLIGLNTILLVVAGSLMISQNELTMGQLIAVIMIASRAITPMAMIAGLIVRWEQTKISLGVLDKIMAAPVDAQTSTLHINALRGAVEMRDVNFAYPGNQPLLKGVSIRIKPGERVGFIGRIGSGKSTILKLLLNLYEPAQGAVLIDGVSAGQIDAQSLRRQVGYVPQDVVLFHGSLRDNILLSGSNVSDEELLQAIRTACLEETLAQMPTGLGTEVGERGERLSGGQRQAVAIARALVRKPKLLLMDEPSSMMDPGTENALINNLRQLTDTTILLVTHRTAMLALVDRLVVMDQGKILLDGPRDEVLKRLQGAGTPQANQGTAVANPNASQGGAA